MDERRIAETVESVVRAVRGITLPQAKKLVAAVEKRALFEGVRVVVAVSDAGGNPVLCERMCDAYLASWDIALQKSYTSAALKMSTAELGKQAAPGGPLAGIENTNGGRIVIFGGGEPLERGGRVVGGLGVSGGTAEQDTALAAYGKSIFGEIE